MAEYTKGEWRIVLDKISKLPVRIQTTSCHVCSFPEDKYLQNRKLRANARLIAAAPDLLEACRNIEACIRMTLTDNAFGSKEKRLMYHNEIKAAIAKATG